MKENCQLYPFCNKNLEPDLNAKEIKKKKKKTNGGIEL